MAGAERGTMTALETARAAVLEDSWRVNQYGISGPAEEAHVDALIAAAQEDAAAEYREHMNRFHNKGGDAQAENAELRAALADAGFVLTRLVQRAVDGESCWCIAHGGGGHDQACLHAQSVLKLPRVREATKE